jgi:hypothetical protein
VQEFTEQHLKSYEEATEEKSRAEILEELIKE